MIKVVIYSLGNIAIYYNTQLLICEEINGTIHIYEWNKPTI